MSKELYGLVLVGGQSRRMGRDKALLSYDGVNTQLERTASLLQATCAKVFISQREEQAFPTPSETDPIYDAVDNIHGPLCGILSAMQAHPQAHWLVLACDLPNLQQSTLEKLIQAFNDKGPELIAYRSSSDGLPEPLCAIYPAGCATELRELALEIGKHCPRKMLIIKDATLIEQDDPRSLDNINTSGEFQAATQ